MPYLTIYVFRRIKKNILIFKKLLKYFDTKHLKYLHATLTLSTAYADAALGLCVTKANSPK